MALLHSISSNQAAQSSQKFSPSPQFSFVATVIERVKAVGHSPFGKSLCTKTYLHYDS